MGARKPVVAGKFYDGNPEGLKTSIEKCFQHKIGAGKLPEVNAEGERKIIGLVSPHAGYAYSGPVASHGFAALAQDGVPDTVVIIGPNHQGMGKPVALSAADEWETPLGKVKVDKEMGKAILDACSVLEEDENAHQLEHSIEVQIPFLQYLYKDKFSIVPICMLEQSTEVCEAVGKAIAGAAGGKNVVVLASTDLTHYEELESVKRKDKLVLQYILKVDPQGVIGIVNEFEISMCGSGPVAAMLFAAKGMGVKESTFLKYANSGDVSGDFSRVVGYASLVIKK